MNYNDFSSSLNKKKSEFHNRLPSIIENEVKLLQGGINANQSGMMHVDEEDNLLGNGGANGHRMDQDSYRNHLAFSTDTRKKTILCVDDNFVNLSSFRLQLEMMGFKGDIRCF